MGYVTRTLAALALGALVVLATWGGFVLLTEHPEAAAQDVAPYSGSLLYLSNGDVWRLDLQTEERSRLLDIGPGLITHVAHSPDRQRLAIAVVNLDETYRVVSSEIVTTAADGTDRRVVIHEEGSNVALGAPAWAPDGRRIVYVTTRLDGGRRDIGEVDVTTGARSLLVDDGSSPSPSPDGRWVAYDRQVGRVWSIWGLERDTGVQSEIVPSTWFDDADVPTFGPDSDTLAFAAAGLGPIGPSGLLQARRIAAHVGTTVRAHDLVGAFFDLWTIHRDGTGLQRVAVLFSTQPALAWSPSGQHVAVWSSLGLQIVDVTTGGWRLITAPGASGSVSWAL
jgi:Tol biopolymer transport system component